MTTISGNSNLSNDGLLFFRVGPHSLALDLKVINGLVTYKQIQDAPETPDGFYYGLIRNHRKFIPLVGLEKKMGLPPRVLHEGEAIVIGLFEESQVALKIDNVVELKTDRVIESKKLPGGITRIDKGFFAGWVETGEVGAYLLEARNIFDANDIETLCSYAF